MIIMGHYIIHKPLTLSHAKSIHTYNTFQTCLKMQCEHHIEMKENILITVVASISDIYYISEESMHRLKREISN